MAAAKGLPWWVIATLVAILFINTAYGTPQHFWRIRSARRALTKLKTMDSPAQQFSYLRQVDPFVFEEMILTALSDLGHPIRRNRRYTGDGGIDGRATINGTKTLIQAKRYRQHISAAHVADFATTCHRSNHQGLFVHTGRTGKQSHLNNAAGTVDIVSGSRMLALMSGEGFSPRWK